MAPVAAADRRERLRQHDHILNPAQRKIPKSVPVPFSPAPQIPHQPLHPRAFASVEKSEGVKTLSRQFYELLADTGLTRPKAHRRSEIAPGRDGPRELSPISFHSLRHTATSLMKNAGINASVVMDIIGHESEAISAHYTHVDEDTKREAIAKLPRIR